MRVLVQRVSAANVVVNGATTGAIGNGLLLLVGVTHDDSEAIEDRMADKIVKLRIFSDDAGLMNRSVLDVGGEILAVSQFTLYADARKGNRPSYTDAARPEQVLLFDLHAWDANCPQHIPQRFGIDDVAHLLAERDARIAALEAELLALRGGSASPPR